MTDAPALKPMSHFTVGVVVERRRLTGPWASHAWVPAAVLPSVPAAEPWTSLGREGEGEMFYAGAAEVELHPAATGHYGDNLLAERPAVWVCLRPVGNDEVELAAVTVDPYEGEAMAESIGEIVEAVPMPDEVRAIIGAYYEAFHVERAFIKRRRDRADPEALGRRGVVDGEHRARARRQEDDA